MTRRKDFLKKKSASKKKLEPLFLDFGDTSFECKPKRSGAAIINFIASSAGAEEESETSQVGRILPFLYGSLKTDEIKESFKEYIENDENDIELEDLIDMVGYLIEEYTARPTEASAD